MRRPSIRHTAFFPPSSVQTSLGPALIKLLWPTRITDVPRRPHCLQTSLGPAYIKLGQALSIRPDLLSPAAMNEMQKLCDKVGVHLFAQQPTGFYSLQEHWTQRCW